MTETKKNFHKTMEMGRTGCPKILVTTYQHTPHDIPADRRPLGNFQIKHAFAKYSQHYQSFSQLF